MKRRLQQFCVLLSLVLAMPLFVVLAAKADDNELTTQEKRDGWILLFDGKSVKHWKLPNGKTLPKANVSGGAINPRKSGGYICYYDKKFGDFIFACDFKVSRSCNSGIFFRTGNPKNPVQTGIELQILDSAAAKKPGKHSCGAIYDLVAPSKNTMKRAGAWNHVEIECRNNLIKVRMNGSQIIDMNLDRWTEAHKNPDGTRNKFATAYKDMPRTGYIGFQDHGHNVWYKNVKIKPLTANLPRR